MKKRILLVVTCMLVSLLAACGSTDPYTVDYNGHSYEELQTVCRSYAETLEGMDISAIETAAGAGTEEIPEILLNWAKMRPELGEFTDYGGFVIDRAGKTLTTEQTVNYENRPVVITCVYDYRNMEITDVTVDRVYTLNEKMKRAGLNTVMCMGVVFAVLIVLSLLIYAFKVFAQTDRKQKEKDAAQAAEATPEEKQEQDKKKLFAIAAAAIAASSGRSADSFHVTSVRETEK